MSERSNQTNRRGCLFYATVLGAALLVLLLIGVAVGYYAVRRGVETLTDSAPAQLPQVQVTSAEAREIQLRFQGFRDALRARSPAPPLTLTDHEINALIATSPEFSDLKGKVHVEIRDGQVRGQVSLPLDQVGVGPLKGRFLNGTGTFKIDLEEGRLKVTLRQIEVKGKPLPRSWMSRFWGMNLAQDLNEDPQSSAMIGALKSLQVKDNGLVVVPKNSQR